MRRRKRPRADARTLPLRPIAIAIALAGAAAAVFFVLREQARHRVTLVFERQGAAATPIDLTFFPDRLAFAAPSPPPPLGECRVDGDTITLGRDLVPEQSVVRYRAEGFGAGYAYVRLGEQPPPLRLRPPASLRGRVGEPVAFWCYGWRCAGLRPVAGAEVLLMGGGEHGVEIVRTTTDGDGRFELGGFDSELDGLGLRVRAAGFALAHASLTTTEPTPVVAVERGEICRGTLVAPAGVDPTQLLVLARGLPGVQAQPDPAGAFVLDHLPRDMTPRLLVAGLGPHWAHAPARANTKAPLRIEIVPAAVVRGRVVDAASRTPLAGALVQCGEQAAVRSDGDGRYELPHQLPGDVEIEAQWDVVDHRRRRTSHFGRTAVRLTAGSTHDSADIEVVTR
jgi:hypothetical protein